jgi:vacuole morphology and inheritance protein 14
MLLPQSSAFAALKNRLNSVSAIGYLHIAQYSSASGAGSSRTYVSSQVSNFHSRQKSRDDGPLPGGSSSLLSPSPTSTLFPSTLGGSLAHTIGNDRQAGSTSTSSVVSNFERPNRLKAREDSNVRWVELLEKFRTTQERARKQGRGPLAGEDVGSPPPVPDKEQGVVVTDPARGVQGRVIPRAGTPTGGVPVSQAPAPQKG